MKFSRKTHWTSQVRPELDGEEVVLAGWVWDVRDLGKIRFIILRDREGFTQITVKKGQVDEKLWNLTSTLSREDVITVKGIVKASKIAKIGVEVIPREIQILNKSKSLPIDIWGNVETELPVRLNFRAVDLKRPSNLIIFTLTSIITKIIRETLYSEGFIEVFTPKIITTSTEGGAELFIIHYFDKVAYLAQSPQLYKEQLTASLERIFEIAPAYRAEKHNTNYHLNEFISVDIEAAFMDYEDVMNILDKIIFNVYEELRVKHNDKLRRIGVELRSVKIPFRRITYDEALELLKEHGLKIERGEDIPQQGLKMLSQIFEEPFYIIHWPTSLRPFYTKPIEGNEELSESFDLIINGIEVASGSTRIHDKEELEKAMIKRGLNPENFKEHLMVFDYGMPPHAGWGLGLYRLTMAIFGRENIREVVLYPRDRYRLSP